jgi:hypothetical protein
MSSGSTLEFTNSRSENVRVHPVVIPELKFRDVQRQMFGADFVEAADDFALLAPTPPA